MNNKIGFEDEEWYKIVSVADGTVIQIDGENLICAPEDETKRNLQRFQAIAQDAGEFRLTSNSGQVWDYFPHSNELLLNKKSAAEKSTQVWRFEKVPDLDAIFFLKSVPTTPSKCLKNMNSKAAGTGQQIKIVDGDNHTYWRLVPDPLA